MSTFPFLDYFLPLSMEMTKCERLQEMHVIQSVHIVLNMWCKDKDTFEYARTNECSSEQFFKKKSMLQRTQRNTTGRCSRREHMTFRASPLCLERQSSPMLSFVSFNYLLICTMYKIYIH